MMFSVQRHNGGRSGFSNGFSRLWQSAQTLTPRYRGTRPVALLSARAAGLPLSCDRPRSAPMDVTNATTMSLLRVVQLVRNMFHLSNAPQLLLDTPQSI